ncbi:hypothetical protein BDQ17DRAFT_1347534 [Cyathus striatus]|nr:hypothetical protein BDQ17DRAFT_1347534 [Cyathus striatus]
MITPVTLFILGIFLPFVLVSGSIIPRSGCDISRARILDLPSTLPTPDTTLSFVAVAFGTQNYTCGSTGTYTNIGAFAELIDISCIYGTPVFSGVQDILYDVWNAAPREITTAEIVNTLQSFVKTPAILGQHYFVQNPITGQGISPKWDFTSAVFAGNPNAFVVGAKVGDILAPTGSQDIDWLALTKAVGSLADQVYRTDTHKGQPPSSCTPGSPDIFVKYTSKYWLFGGSIKH